MDTYAFAEASSKVKGRSYEVTKKSTVVPTVGFFGTVNRTPRELKGADGLKQELLAILHFTGTEGNYIDIYINN